MMPTERPKYPPEIGPEIIFSGLSPIDRRAILSALIGTAWKDRGMCWGLARHVEAALFGRTLPEIAFPADPSWAWMIQEIGRHAERNNWREVPPDPAGLIRAGDGALMLMARKTQPAHIGVWCRAEGAVIHAPTTRVAGEVVVNAVFETPAQLRTSGWTKHILLEPVN